MYQQWLQAVKKKSFLSRPKRPPRPYDYSKADRYTTGMLYIPKKLMVSRVFSTLIVITQLLYATVLPRYAMHSAEYAVARCPSVCLSVRPYI